MSHVAQLQLSPADAGRAGRSMRAIKPRASTVVADRERQRALRVLHENAPLHGGVQEKLGKVIASAVETPGGLLRFQLALQGARAFGATPAASDALGCAVEYFHIASLLLDDLPQMDDSLERHGNICPHLLFGENMVILGALGLITKAYQLLGEVISLAPAATQRSAHAFIEQCLGTAGMLNGQARDLTFQNTGDRREVLAVAVGKTAQLIHLPLALPALLFGGDARMLLRLRRLSIFWGLFYQGMDDLKDLLQKSDISGKTAGRDQPLGRPNIALVAGVAEAKRHLPRLGRLAGSCVEVLVRDRPQLAFLRSFQTNLWTRWEALVS